MATNRSMNVKRQCLIIGAAIGYRYHQIAPFLKSLERSGYQGDLLLFTDRTLQRELAEESYPYKINCRIAPKWIPFSLRLLKGRRRYFLFLWSILQFQMWMGIRLLHVLPLPVGLRHSMTLWIAVRLFPPTQTRYLLAADFLEKHGYQTVLLCDVRDVYFQSDPFVKLQEFHFAIGIETEPKKLSQQRHNARWILLGYGRDMLRAIGDRPISCSGVTFGHNAEIMDYLRKMNREILNMHFRTCAEAGLDQGIHNKIVWMKEVGNFQCLHTFSSPLATLSSQADMDSLRFNDEGELVGREGEPIAILHMYDRDPVLKKRMLGKLNLSAEAKPVENSSIR